MQEFIQAQTEEPAPPRLPLMQQWRPPNSQCYKVNFDAVVFCATSRVGIGIIARDSEGVALGALSSSIPLAQSVADVEASACLRAVQVALEIGLTRVVFEGDSAVIISALIHANGEVASYGNILEDIRLQVAAFQFVAFSHVSCICNSVADALANKAKSVVGNRVWLSDMPADIALLLYHDVH